MNYNIKIKNYIQNNKKITSHNIYTFKNFYFFFDKFEVTLLSISFL